MNQPACDTELQREIASMYAWRVAIRLSGKPDLFYGDMAQGNHENLRIIIHIGVVKVLSYLLIAVQVVKRVVGGCLGFHHHLLSSEALGYRFCALPSDLGLP